MIKTTLPIIEKSIDEKTKTLIVKEGEIEITIDTSLFAEERWEKYFPDTAKRETLFAYIERFKNDGFLTDKAKVVSSLKALYCFMEGDNIADFKSFCQLFDIAQGEYLNRLIDKIKFIFEIALSSSTTDSKN